MNISEFGIEMIKGFEGLRLTAYKAIPSEKYFTIGYGHYGVDVKKGMSITVDEADKLLRSDIKKFEKKVNKYYNRYGFNQNQFDALVSFAFNIGNIDQLTAFGTRSLKTISSKMLLYNKAGGVKLAGLVKRRQKENELFNKPVTKKSDEVIAAEVIKGLWGNGSARKKALTNAGYDYKKIQKLVNNLLK